MEFLAESIGLLDIMDGSSSRESFAVKEVSRDLKKLTMITASETTANTADPKTMHGRNQTREESHRGRSKLPQGD